MIPELGYLALLLTLTCSVALGVLPLLGVHRSSVFKNSAFTLTAIIFITTAISVAILAYSFLSDDFSVLYVAQHSNINLDTGYKLAAVWGGHEGSMLFLLLSLTLWMLGFALSEHRLSHSTYTITLSVLGITVATLALFILFYSNPFARQFPIPINGRDLNPMLQHIGLILHPPLLYIGYTGFAISFGLSLTALLEKRLDTELVYQSKKWTLAAWGLLTVGILLGSWWAYGELGWGGWWFWDPVENVSLLPWLAATALLHAQSVTIRRGQFVYWTILLSLLTFLLALLGTFVVRSGILTSVHAFAINKERGNTLLLVLVFFTLSALTIFTLRAHILRVQSHFHRYSRESLLLFSLLLFCVAIFIVALGTFYPMLLGILGMPSISVGAPYFNLTFMLPTILALFAMGLSESARWQEPPLPVLRPLYIALFASIGIGLLIPFLMDGEWNLTVSLLSGLAIWVILTAFSGLFQAFQQKFGIFLAHCGVAICVLGVVLSGHYTVETSLRMGPGITVDINRYQISYQETLLLKQANYTSEQAYLTVNHQGEYYASLFPERRHYSIRDQVMSEAGTHWSFTGDLYVVMGEKLNHTDYAMRLYYKPFISWIWLGGIMMCFGAAFSLVQKMIRQKRPS